MTRLRYACADASFFHLGNKESTEDEKPWAGGRRCIFSTGRKDGPKRDWPGADSRTRAQVPAAPMDRRFPAKLSTTVHSDPANPRHVGRELVETVDPPGCVGQWAGGQDDGPRTDPAEIEGVHGKRDALTEAATR